MIKNYSLVVLAFLCFILNGFGQTETLDCPLGTVVGTDMTFNTANFTIVHAKGTDANLASYSPWRVYTNNTVTFTGGASVVRITSIVITATSTSYASAAIDGTLSIIAGTGTISGSSSGTTATITVTGTDVTAVRIKPSAQSRWSSIAINYEAPIKPEPTNHATTFACGSTTNSSIPLTWTDATGSQVPDGYLIKWSSTSYAAITAPTDGTFEADGSTSKNIAKGVETYSATGLAQNTIYYFKIWSYTNSGTNINYKTNGTIPQTSCKTQAGPCLSEGFDGGTTAPTGWAFTGLGTYTSAGNYGVSSPSLQFNDTNDQLLTASFSNAKSLSFWLKGNSTNATSSLLVEGYDGTSWVTVENIQPLPTSGTTITYDATSTPSLPINITQFRFTYTKSSGNLAFDDLEVYCNVTSTEVVDWCNLQFPENGNITVPTAFDVYAQVYEPGVTNSVGQGPGIDAWIGYNTVNNNPNSALWTWVPATYNGDPSANNDEYKATLSGLPSGNYYYASRFQIDGGPFRYGGYDTGGGDGFWDATRDISGVLSVDTVDYCSLEYPVAGSIVLGDAFSVYGQVYEQGLTPGLGQGAGIVAEIGYNLANTNPNTWTNWISTTYNAACLDCNDVAGIWQNDEYTANLGGAITSPGTYYYATRFKINNGVWLYGGILADESAGGFWNNAPYISGILTVTNVPQCHTEDFSGLSSTATSYATRTWTGTGGIWTATDAREEQVITPGNKAITIRNGVLTSPEFTDGIGSLTVTTKLYESGSSGTLSLKVNGIIKGSIPYSSSAQTTTISGINIPYETVISLENNSSSNRVIIDDLSWTCYECPSPAADPTGTIAGDTPECNSTELTYSAPSATTFWQTSLNGHSTANPTTAPFEVTTSGTYYVNTYDGTCWSTNAMSYPVIINYSSDIDVQPADQLTTVGGTVVFSVNATNVTSYQWQESADGVSWSNVGTNSSTYTLTNVQLIKNGYKYRVVLTSATCGTLTSDIATLFIYNTNCIDESFNVATTGATPPVGWGGNSLNHTDPLHYQSGPNCRELSNNKNIITPAVDNPEVLQFYQDASNGGDGEIATVEYKIGTAAYVPLYSFAVTKAGRNELVNLSNVAGVDLRTKTNVRFRFASTFNTWYLDDVKVFCTPCVNSASIATALPTSGPEGTYVTITGSDYSAATTVKFNGIPAVINSWTATQLVVIVPTGAVDGNILISTTGFCESVIPFDVIDKDGSACQSTFNGSDLFIYEIFDEDSNANGPPVDYGNGGMITILNPTLQTVNLSNYKLYRSGTVGIDPYTVWHSPTGTLAPGELLRIKVEASKCTGYVAPFDTVIIGFNANDGFELRKLNPATSTFVSIDQALMPNYVGYYYLRDLNATNPSATYNGADWTITNIWNPPSNTTTCVPVGITPPFSGSLPNITSFVVPASSCDTASITVNATEGYNETSPADAKQLNFEWYYYDGITDVWTLITTGGDYTITTTINDVTGIGSSKLDVSNVFDKVDYQYYCRVRENDATCYVASRATKLNVAKTTWNGIEWTPIAPTINTVAVIDGDYDTSIGGVQTSFSACQLIVNPGRTLTISANKYVEVQNNVFVNGEIIVSHTGSFVQINDAGTVTGEVLTDPTRIKVEKETAILNNWFEYTYWSSPVANETIGVALSDAHPNRRFWFDAQNFLDAFEESGNNNTLVPGHDDIDDDADDWTLAPAGMTMSPGVGYAATHRNVGFVAGLHYKYTFSGAFNNGVYTVPVYRNDAETLDNNWNFLGNPYPSAISADSFLAENTLFDLNGPGSPMTGAIFLWSQNTNPSGSSNGNENLNFAQSDYAIINGSGQTAGGDSIVPTRYIPSGQGFFVAMANAATSTSAGGTIKTANVTFNNSMRVKTNNDQFFRTSENGMVDNRLWINLTSNSGVFNQILVAYVPGATDGDDGMYYDATKNLSSGANTIIYTLIDSETDLKLAIQGKNPNSLNIEERIALGFYTSINEPTNFRLSIADLEGDFLTTNTIYLVDHLMNLTFNLSAGDYIFSSDKGEFNERFEIVFRDQALSVVDNELPLSGLSIIELPNGEVKFTVGNNLNIQKVEIIDMLGRTLYQLRGNHSSEVYDLSNLSQAPYMAKVTLSNGQVLVKKAVKQR